MNEYSLAKVQILIIEFNHRISGIASDSDFEVNLKRDADKEGREGDNRVIPKG